MHRPQMTLEQHPSLLSSGAETCFSFLVSRLSEAPEVLGKSLNTVAQVQQASAEEEDMTELSFRIHTNSK